MEVIASVATQSRVRCNEALRDRHVAPRTFRDDDKRVFYKLLAHSWLTCLVRSIAIG